LPITSPNLSIKATS